MDNICKQGVGVLKDAPLCHTPHTKKQTIEHVIASHVTNSSMPKRNYRSIEPQNVSTFHEHATQGRHNVMGKA